MITHFSFGQALFNKRINFNGNENGFSLYADSNNIYVAFGIGTNKIAAGIFKIDNNGNLLDTSIVDILNVFTYPGGSHSLNKCKDGFILGGSYKDTINTDAYLMKFDLNLDTVWTKRFGDSTFQSGWVAKEDVDGGYLLCGQAGVVVTGDLGQAHFLKTDSLGNIIWHKFYGDSVGGQLFFDLTKTLDGGYALAGFTQNHTGYSDIYLVKTDSIGNLQWDSTFSYQWGDIAFSIISTLDGNIAIAGQKSYHMGVRYRSFVAKFDLAGNMLWEKEYHDTVETNLIHSIRELEDGSFIVAGYLRRANAKMGGLIMKLSSNGDSIWGYDYFNGLSLSNCELYDIYPTEDGGFVASGVVFTQPPDTGDQDIWILKVDSLGCELANCTVDINEIVKNLYDVNIFPNPFTNHFRINVAPPNKEYDIRIFNNLGVEVKRIDKYNGEEIAVQNLNSGLYLLHVYHKNKLIYEGKICKVE
jgi:hypothetical protein